MGFKPETIEKWSILYAIFKQYVKFLYQIYFRLNTHNSKNIPKDEILVYAANHQNALMDALAFITTTKGQHIFLGRADIFKKRIILKNVK
jgi:1-acyl-sn-glycerol-3-phosphate acyltransferase